MIQFADQIKENILYPVPPRQYVFSLPIILRVYFKHRKLFTKLCHCAYESLLEFLRTTIGLSDSVPGVGWYCDIMPVKVGNSQGTIGGEYNVSDGLYYADPWGGNH